MPFSPPTNVQLVDAKPGELTFKWTPPPEYCPSLTFNVLAENCGTCQNNSALTNATCKNFTLSTRCTLMVQSIICGNLASSNPSSPATVSLNGIIL